MDKLQKIREELARLKEETSIGLSEHENGVEQGRMKIINAISLCLDTLQEEPVSEDNTLRKASEEYLKVLSETPYNNTPITNTQTIVRELITFLDNPSKYNPNHIEESVSENFKQFEDEYLDKEKDEILCIYDRHAGLVDGAKWQKQ